MLKDERNGRYYIRRWITSTIDEMAGTVDVRRCKTWSARSASEVENILKESAVKTLFPFARDSCR